jgi:hypothetical protein
MQTTRFIAVAMAAGCIDYDIGQDLPEWPAPAPRPVDEVTRTDVILQTQTPKVDILWMVDNSCSMGDDQTRLTQNFPTFMDYFVGSGLDYHVGVTSSDIISTAPNGADGKLVIQRGLKFIDIDTPDPILIFSEMATLGIGGRFPEKGLGGTYKCLEEKRDTINAGFYRDEASLHTIIISDEADYTQSSLITQPEYEQWYSGLKAEQGDRTFSGIISAGGSRYRQTIDAVGGIEDSVLNSDWSEVLQRLGIQAAGLKREYFLSGVPVLGTIEVTVENPGGAVIAFDEAVVDPVTGSVDGEWTYDEARNSVTFVEFVPDSLSKVVLHYTVLASQQSVDEIPE